jgi:glycosyltransferase involved in cell wall biosynthesis
MKVLHVTPSVPKVRGGTTEAVLGLVKALRENSIDAEIATTNDNGDSLLDVPLQKRIEYEQVPVWFFHRFSPTVKSLREFAFSRQLTEWLWQNISNYDLLHVHALFSYPSTVAMAIARIKQIPYILTPHGLLCEWSLQQSSRKKQIYLRLIESANLNSSKAIHFTSQQEQQEVSLLGIVTPGFVLPFGLSLPTLIPGARERLRHYFNLPADELVILFMSRLHEKKGLDYLIQALSKLTHHRFTFILAGSGSPEYETQVESLLVSTRLCDRTHLVGFVEGEIKNLLLQGSDLFALTSYSENFGVVILEAMAAGLPVFVTPGVALASVVQQQGVGFVVEQDIHSIASAIENYLIYPQNAKIVGDRARQFILENYTWDKIACQMEQVYLDILQKESSRASTNSVSICT